jgi:hypothetical protein
MCGFPVLEWKKGGESVPMRSDAAFFLSRLGMLTYIPLSTLITLISTDYQKRPALLRYLVERFESVYKNQYKAESIKIPFLPISSNYRQDSKSEVELALPSAGRSRLLIVAIPRITKARISIKAKTKLNNEIIANFMRTLIGNKFVYFRAVLSGFLDNSFNLFT